MSTYYREWNAPIPTVSARKMQRLDAAHPTPRSLKRIAKPQAIKPCRKYSKVNDGFKVVMVALRFGSITDFNRIQ